MKRFPSIKKNSDFQAIYRTAKSYANRQLVMYVRKTENTQSRIGISVSKKVGNSVVRHHLARLVRESFRLNRDTLEEGLDIIVVARAAAKDSDYKTIERAFMHLCGLHNIKKNRSETMINRISGLIKKLLILMIRGYQIFLSPLKVRTHCIYTPTCSQYAIEALTRYGVVKGLWLSVKRILRCHPWAEGGYDPVP